MKFGTKLVQFDAAPGDPLRPSATPIYQTATFAQEEADAFGKFDYSRSGNPTRKVLEDHMAALEQGTIASEQPQVCDRVEARAVDLDRNALDPKLAHSGVCRRILRRDYDRLISGRAKRPN